MLARYSIATNHGEGATVWAIFDSEEQEWIASFNSTRGETFGDAYQYCYGMNLLHESAVLAERGAQLTSNLTAAD